VFDNRKVVRFFPVVFALIALFVGSGFAQNKPLTARQVIARIQAQIGGTWQSDTVDTFKTGNPDAPVTGIAVTMMSTLDVLQRAAAAGDNLIITHEPTFYDHRDNPVDLPEKEKDAVLAAKRAFIEKHGLIIWRFHDYWHRPRPDGIVSGMVRAMGWEKFQDPANQYLFALPDTTLEKLAAEMKARLGIRVVRVVGDPNLQVKKVAFSPGASGFAMETGALERNDIEVVVLGETREWETVEYVSDAIAEGKHKGLIVLGHIPSEQPGMEECARWLRTFITEVPVQFVPAAEPFWEPK
jgi:putative NIF3 family GTP cyclohydrolase 1 type 2